MRIRTTPVPADFPSAANLSLAVWLLKGFVDEIPREYEEAAVVDGELRGSRRSAKVVLPQMRAGIAATDILFLADRLTLFDAATDRAVPSANGGSHD